MGQRRNIVAAVLAGVLLAVFLMSIGIFALRMNHECIGDGCRNCAQICLAKEAVEHITLACGSVLCLLLPICCLVLKTGKYFKSCVGHITLFKLKVKLSN